MTPAEMHFAARLADVAENLTSYNETATDLINMTAHGISKVASHVIPVTQPPKSSVQMPWIELGLIPIAPVVACYLFTKIADYIFERIAALRQRRSEAHHDAHLDTVFLAREGPNAHPDDNPEVAAYRKLIADAGAKASEDSNTRYGLGKSVLRHLPTMKPRSTSESSQLAGAKAQNPVYIGNNLAVGQVDDGTLTRGRDKRYGVGREGTGGRDHRERGAVERGGEQLGGRAGGAGAILLVEDASVGQKKSKRDG